MANYVNGPEIPMGLGMALAENLNAMEYFASLSPAQQYAVIERPHQNRSTQEMRAFVQSLPSTPPAIG